MCLLCAALRCVFLSLRSRVVSSGSCVVDWASPGRHPKLGCRVTEHYASSLGRMGDERQRRRISISTRSLPKQPLTGRSLRESHVSLSEARVARRTSAIPSSPFGHRAVPVIDMVHARVASLLRARVLWRRASRSASPSVDSVNSEGDRDDGARCILLHRPYCSILFVWINYLLGKGSAVATQLMLSVAFWYAWHDAAVSSRCARLRFCTLLYAEPLLARSSIRVQERHPVWVEQ